MNIRNTALIVLMGLALAIPVSASARQNQQQTPKPQPASAYVANKWEAGLRPGSPQQCAHPGSHAVAQAQIAKGLCR